jgi:hypothetical protein
MRLSAGEDARIRHTLGERAYALFLELRAALPERGAVLCRSGRDDATVWLVNALRTLLYPVVLTPVPAPPGLFERAQARGEPCLLLDLDPATRAGPPAGSTLVARGAGFELWRQRGEGR